MLAGKRPGGLQNSDFGGFQKSFYFRAQAFRYCTVLGKPKCEEDGGWAMQYVISCSVQYSTDTCHRGYRVALTGSRHCGATEAPSRLFKFLFKFLSNAMGKCYCDYCDVFLTNDSVAVRKQHNDGNRHKYNVCEYYRQYIGQQLQEKIDLIVQNFERRVASGSIIPTYALPTPKIVPKPQNESEVAKDSSREEGVKNTTDEEPKSDLLHSQDKEENTSQPPQVAQTLQT